MHFKLLFFFSFLFYSASGSTKYWVSFSDKNGVAFDPLTYFESRTIEQRILQHIPLVDSTDFPLNQFYVQQITILADSVSWQSRWLNGIAIYASPLQVEKMKLFSFVSCIVPMTAKAVLANKRGVYNNLSKIQKELLNYQTTRLKGNEFAKQKLDGTGIRIAVFDAGFPGVDKHPAFDHLRKNCRIIATYDFIKKREDVYHFSSHGTATLSCIAGLLDTVKIGMATGAEVLLARTEYAREIFSEEENWLAAAEWADRQGVNIISSSLGYLFERYFNFEMNGKTSLVARAATIAAQKGILVISAAGNEGSDKWHFIDTPSDADSVLTVGGTDPFTDFHIYFSSYGPTSDGRLKPNVSAPGQAIVATESGYAVESGTSFSTPLVAGFAACAWQKNRSWTNMQLFNAIEKSAHLYPYFDYAHGFGIPQADHILSNTIQTEPTFDFVIVNDEIKVVLREKYAYPEMESALGYKTQRNFYYKLEDSSGTILYYKVLSTDQKEMLHLTASQFNKGDVLTVHFEGYTSSFDLQDDDSDIK